MASFYENLNFINNRRFPASSAPQGMPRLQSPAPFLMRLRQAEAGGAQENPSQENIENSAQNAANDQPSMVIPKAPSFKYTDPTVNNNIAYWELFSDADTMKHYGDLMNILDDIDNLGSVEDIKKYINGVKDTTMYKVNPGIQTWTNDLEAQYYGLDKKYELSYPTALMRRQTEKAREEFVRRQK